MYVKQSLVDQRQKCAFYRTCTAGQSEVFNQVVLFAFPEDHTIAKSTYEIKKGNLKAPYRLLGRSDGARCRLRWYKTTGREVKSFKISFAGELIGFDRPQMVRGRMERIKDGAQSWDSNHQTSGLKMTLNGDPCQGCV